MNSTEVAVESQEAVALAQYFVWSRFCELSAVTVIVYDYIITFDEEVRFAWNKRWYLAKTLFMLVRYWNFSSITLDTFALFHSGLSDGVSILSRFTSFQF